MTARQPAGLAAAWLIATGCAGTSASLPPNPPGNRTSALAPPAGARAIDWRNASYELTLLEGEGATAFTLVDGAWGDPAVEAVRLDDVVFGDLTGDGVDEAAVLSTYRAPGYEFDRVDVYAADGGAPRWLGVVRGGDAGDADELLAVEIQGGMLRVRRPSAEAEGWERWRWDGAYFEQAPR